MSLGFIASCDEQLKGMNEKYQAKKFEEQKDSNQMSKSQLKKLKKQKSK
jgi:hypothetical protein